MELSRAEAIDAAFDEERAGNGTAALGWALALHEGDRKAALPLVLLARALRAVGSDGADAAAKAACRRSIDEGDLLLAVVAAGAANEREPELAEIARAFGVGSDRIGAAAGRPPALPGAVERRFRPQGGASLRADGARAAQAAWRGWEEEDLARPVAPRLRAEPLFSELAPVELETLLRSLRLRAFGRKDVVYEEGSTGSAACFVVRGELTVTRNLGAADAVLLARLGPGSLVGEMALISQAPRAASVVGDRPGLLLTVEQSDVQRAAAKAPRIGVCFADHCRTRMMTNLLRTSPLLRAVPKDGRSTLLAQFKTCTFEAGETLVAAGQTSTGLHLVASGSVTVTAGSGGTETIVAQLGPGDVVGEVSLILHRPAGATVVAEVPTVTLHLPSKDFLGFVKAQPALFAELYELAVKRSEETNSLLAEQDADADDAVLV